MSTSGDPVLDAVRGLEDDFADAMSRMYAVGNDLARLRGRLVREASPQQWTPVAGQQQWTPVPGQQQWTPVSGHPAPPVQAPAGAAAAHAGMPTTAPTTAPSGLVTPPPAPRPPFAAVPATAPPATTPWWQRDGFVPRLLAVVGAGITLIGVAFLLALAIQLGFFGPIARVTSGILLAVGLLVAAVVVRRRDAGTAGALGLAATGVAAGYLDVIAVTSIYEWVPLAVGLAIAGLVALGGLLLARAWDSQLLAVIAVLGVAVLAPAVGHEHGLLTGGFLLVLAIASWPAHLSRAWHVLELARIVPTSFVVSVLALVEEPAGPVALLAGGLVGLVLVTSLLGTRLPTLPAQTGLLVPIAALPLIVTALAADRWVGIWLLVGLTLALVAVAALAQESDETPAHLLLGVPCLATAGPTSLLAADRFAQGSDWTLTALLAVGLLWAIAALVLHHRTTLWVALGSSAVGIIATLSLVPYAATRWLADEVVAADVVSAVAAVVLLLLLARGLAMAIPSLSAVPVRVLLAGALLWAGGSVILAGIVLGGLVDNPRAGFTGGQTGATLLWLSTAAVLLVRGLRGSSVAVPAGLAITAVSIGKLLFFDLAFLDGIARVLSFIVGGLIVLGTGVGYAQALERSRRSQQPVENSTGDSPDPRTV